jgi:hypothetical protein
MASICSAVVAIALVASEPSPMEKVERRAGILSGIGVGFALGGAFAIAVGAIEDESRFVVGGGALVGVAVHLIALAVVAWLWPDDGWLGLLTDETARAALQGNGSPQAASWLPQR